MEKNATILFIIIIILNKEKNPRKGKMNNTKIQRSIVSIETTMTKI